MYKRLSSTLLFLAGFCSLNSICAKGPQESRDSFRINLRDTQNMLVTLHYDVAGLPEYYSSDLFTQVCETGECKPVRIILHWNLIGQYLDFEMPPGAILTKMDHVPFDEKDYEKFARILQNKQSMLEDFDIRKLSGTKEKATIHQIDGITGATPKSIASDIVEGAVYTCHTIWHLAHGPIQDTLAAFTLKITDRALLLHLLNHRHDDYQRWSIDQMLYPDEQNKDYLTSVLAKINSENIFLAKYILKKFPDKLLSNNLVQQDLWSKYGELPYSLQILLLKRFKDVPISSNLKTQITKYRNRANLEQTKLIDAIHFNQ